MAVDPIWFMPEALEICQHCNVRCEGYGCSGCQIVRAQREAMWAHVDAVARSVVPRIARVG